MRSRKKRGQAAIEYILLVAISVSIFGYLFFLIRRELFQLWVCEIGPRVQSPIPCRTRDKCFEYIIGYTSPTSKRQAQMQRDACASMR